MKMVETKGERASFLSKEVRRIAFSEITKNDLPELYNSLNKLFWGRRNCKLWIQVGRFNGWFNNEKELARFLDGFAVAMLFLDSDFLNACGDARPGHPQL